MKKIKIILIIGIILPLLTGCFKRDNMDNISIYSTVYPIEYLVKNIYGYNSTINSIYPNGTDTKTYELTEKKLKEYANVDLFVYNGLTSEKSIAASFLTHNSNLKIIDVSKGISLQNDQEELWLCPSNYLMLAQNIKNELIEYTKSTILKQEINEKYDALKLTISKYDAELKLIAENAQNNTIIAGNDVFLFLEKYGFDVISVEESDRYLASYYQEAKNNIVNKKNTYIFVLDTDTINENTSNLEKAGAKIITVRSMTNLTDDEEKDNLDYPKMMMEFIEQIRNEVNN
ncbi:MAG: metal ABC transporter substrate-binding protein [Bacilli bacterium]|nr:metal ABC transporter substrate-binding protein [Bacilli bacterium]